MYAVVGKGSTYLTLQLAGVSGRRYDVTMNNETQSSVAHNATLTFANLEPDTTYSVSVYLIRRVYNKVVVRNNSQKHPLSLAAVQVFDHNNIMVSHAATKVKTVRQTDTVHGGVASRALQNSVDGDWRNNSVTHTSHGGWRYWTLEFSADVTIKQIVIYNRTDCCGERLKGSRLRLYHKSSKHHDVEMSGAESQKFNFDP